MFDNSAKLAIYERDSAFNIFKMDLIWKQLVKLHAKHNNIVILIKKVKPIIQS